MSQRVKVTQLSMEPCAYEGWKIGRTGYYGQCACGWRSRELPSKRAAQGAVAGHVGATIRADQ